MIAITMDCSALPVHIVQMHTLKMQDDDDNYNGLFHN